MDRFCRANHATIKTAKRASKRNNFSSHTIQLQSTKNNHKNRCTNIGNGRLSLEKKSCCATNVDQSIELAVKRSFKVELPRDLCKGKREENCFIYIKNPKKFSTTDENPYPFFTHTDKNSFYYFKYFLICGFHSDQLIMSVL